MPAAPQQPSQGPSSKMMVSILGLVLIIGGVLAYLFLNQTPDVGQQPTPTVQEQKVRLGFSLGTLREERWQKDTDLFTERAGQLGATVLSEFANEDAKLQTTQAENLIIQGIKSLVVVPHDADLAAEIVTKAHNAGVKVIAYDRMINKADVDYYITFDSRIIGELEAKEITKRIPKGKYAYIGGATTDNNAFLHKEGAMRILEPLIKKGDIQLVVDQFTPDWRPEEAYKTMKNYLAKNKDISAVIAANDGTAGGVIQALKEVGLEGKVLVAGADADLAAAQRIVEGTQTVTIYTPLKLLAQGAADAAMDFAKGIKPKTNGTINNGKIDVPSNLLEPTLVTKENIDSTIIKDGFHSREAVYKNVR